MNNTNTEAKTATKGGSVSLTADLHNIKRASDHLRMDLVEYGEFDILQKVANLGATLSCLTLSIRKAQGGDLEDIQELDIDYFINELCELPIFVESLTKVMGSVVYLTRTIERETAEKKGK